MNWLAHLVLSEPDVEFRLGNLLADLVKPRERQAWSPGLQRGAACHQVIDAFTDSHPVVHRSIRNIGEEYAHFGGILVDVFYDHFLARHWSRYSPVPLEQFTAEIYESFRDYPLELPEEARYTLERLSAEDRLASYQSITGIEATLRRISQRLESRLNRPFTLEKAISELTDHYEAFDLDFTVFFPELRARVDRWRLG